MDDPEDPARKPLVPTAELDISPEFLDDGAPETEAHQAAPAALPQSDEPTAVHPDPTELTGPADGPVAPNTDTTRAPDRKALRLAGFAVLAVLLLAGTAIGMFFAGQSTRKSESVVRTETKRAIDRAVNVAVERKGADDKAKRLRIMHRAATRMNARHRVEVRKLRKVADRKAAQAYSSGSSVGRQEGYSDGVGDGVTKATDDLTCSDDPDAPLPYCFYGDY